MPVASDPEGQLSDQSDILANSEVVINCVVSKDNRDFKIRDATAVRRDRK